MRPAYNVKNGIADLIVATVPEFPEVMFNNRKTLDKIEGANLAHAVDHHNTEDNAGKHIDFEKCSDDMFSFADQIVDVLKEVESVDEMKELLEMMNVRDYIDYITALFPMIRQKKREEYLYDYDGSYRKFLNLESVQRSLGLVG